MDFWFSRNNIIYGVKTTAVWVVIISKDMVLHSGIFVLNLRQIDNEKVIRKESGSELYQWAKLFRAESWEELCMLAKKNEAIDECVYTMAKLSEDEKIRMQCEARKDNLAIEIGIRKRAMQEGQKQGALHQAREIAKGLLGLLDKPTIAEKTGLSLEEVEALEKEQG